MRTTVARAERQVAEHRLGLVGEEELQRVVRRAARAHAATTAATTASAKVASARPACDHDAGDALVLGDHRAAHDLGLAVEVPVEGGARAPGFAGDVVDRGLRQAEAADAREDRARRGPYVDGGPGCSRRGVIA